MPWIKPSLQTIINRIESDIETRLTGNVPLLRKAVLKVLARVFAGISYICYGYIDNIAKQIFPDTAEDEFLDRQGYIWGVTRKAATFASGMVTFTGQNGTIIAINTALQNPATGVEYLTSAEGVIVNGVARVAIQSQVPSSSGNIDLPAELILVTPLVNVDSTVYTGYYTLAYTITSSGNFVVGDALINTTRTGTGLVITDNGSNAMTLIITSGDFQIGDIFTHNTITALASDTATNSSYISGGQDAESDNLYRARILLRIATPPSGGTAADYERWAQEVVSDNGSVVAAWAKSSYPSPGQVTVAIKAGGSNPVAPAALIVDVLTYLDTKKPVTANVLVVAIDLVDVTFSISITPNTVELQGIIEQNLTDIFEQSIPGETVLISRIRNAISVAGVDDYTISGITTTPALTPPATADTNMQFTGFQYGKLLTINY